MLYKRIKEFQRKNVEKSDLKRDRERELEEERYGKVVIVEHSV